MKLPLTVSLATLACQAAEIDGSLLRLIGPQTKLVYGVDVERYQQSAMADFFPPSSDGALGVRRLLVIQDEANSARAPWMIVTGTRPWPPVPKDADGEAFVVATYRGVPIVLRERTGVARLDFSTQLFADPAGVRTAIDRWLSQDAPIMPLAEQAHRLSASYDNWFVVDHPIEWRREADGAVRATKYGPAFAKRFQEVRGGIRLGSVNEGMLEAVMGSTEDAFVLAALAQAFPGIVQTMEPDSQLSGLLDLMEDFNGRSQGVTASVSFHIAESELVKFRNSLWEGGLR